ncbi:DUF1707 SHOCT-like domain-containing protein [Actinoplanes sp. CA-051413]|uniref:DUF1707 SHOCT-like domain-containing protein n=1 Tax=Actinoplanes sp. CA-051413 TaxID=3239899 RepID=UPI003D989F36
MRAADADRQAVADQLKAALDEGRLDLHEYDERLQQAYAAKTYGDLRALLDDLPSARVPVPAQREPSGSVVDRDASDAEVTRRWLLAVWSSWILVVGINTVVWLMVSIGSAELIYFWPVWVAGPWGVVLVFVTVAGLVGGEPRKQADKKARKRQAKQVKRERRALEPDPIRPDETLHERPKRDKTAG